MKFRFIFTVVLLAASYLPCLSQRFKYPRPNSFYSQQTKSNSFNINNVRRYVQQSLQRIGAFQGQSKQQYFDPIFDTAISIYSTIVAANGNYRRYRNYIVGLSRNLLTKVRQSQELLGSIPNIAGNSQYVGTGNNIKRRGNQPGGFILGAGNGNYVQGDLILSVGDGNNIQGTNLTVYISNSFIRGSNNVIIAQPGINFQSSNTIVIGPIYIDTIRMENGQAFIRYAPGSDPARVPYAG